MSISLLVTVTGCGPGASSAGPASTRHRATTVPAPVGLDPVYAGPHAAYTYTLRSSCGERSGLGQFRVTVRGGQVVRVMPADEFSLVPKPRSLVPTLEGIVAEAQRARADGADEVIMRMHHGYPVRLSIDYLAEAIDDELCYDASHVTVPS